MRLVSLKEFSIRTSYCLMASVSLSAGHQPPQPDRIRDCVCVYRWYDLLLEGQRHLWPVDKSDGSEGLKFITWNLIQTTEEVARAFIVAASAATVQSTCMSIVFSSKLRWEWQPNAEASATILENHEGVLILSRPVRTLQSKSPHGSKAAMIEALAEVVGLHVTLHVYLCIMHPLSIYCFTYTMQNN